MPILQWPLTHYLITVPKTSKPGYVKVDVRVSGMIFQVEHRDDVILQVQYKLMELMLCVR